MGAPSGTAVVTVRLIESPEIGYDVEIDGRPAGSVWRMRGFGGGFWRAMGADGRLLGSSFPTRRAAVAAIEREEHQ